MSGQGGLGIRFEIDDMMRKCKSRQIDMSRCDSSDPR